MLLTLRNPFSFAFLLQTKSDIIPTVADFILLC